jgi:phosphatidylserine/phosphatidylglycerophosphate/cardiolipin synthase-like enzyme
MDLNFNKNMSLITAALIILICFFKSLNISFAQDDFEIVESVPAETIFEKSALPRTKEVWLKMINNAGESIDIETFYFASREGEQLEEVLNALKNAASRGVKIRIIVDSSFYSGNERSVDLLNDIQNISIRKIPMGRIAGGVMHAKYFIVDGEELFLGSQNMDWRALKHIHEIGVRVNSKELAKSFQNIFETDWNLCVNEYSNQTYSDFSNSSMPVILTSETYGTIVMYPAFSPVKMNTESMSSEESELMKIINNVKDSLLIQLYSYSPKAKNEKNYYDLIDNGLRNAALRGVKIKIVFPDWAARESSILFIKNLSTVNNIEIKFISIPEYSEGFIPYSRVDHCKYLTADNNISWISTSNWEWSYFYSCRNATLIIENEKVNSELSGVFYRTWDCPYVSLVDVNKEYIPCLLYTSPSPRDRG